MSAYEGHLYWCYGDDDELLYIGLTTDVEARLTAHRRSTPWWPTVFRVEHKPLRLLNKGVALAVERYAIQHEKPLHNRQGVHFDVW